MRILLQFPEGLKKHALEHAKEYEKKGHTVFISSAPCYGACDLALEEAKTVKADKIIHFGHAPFIKKKLPVKVEYVEFHIDVNLKNIRKSASQLKEFKKIALATTVQHVHQLKEMKKIFEKTGKKVLIGRGALAFYPGQVLGCDAGAVLSVSDKADAVVFIGDGLFHPLAIGVEKPVFVIHPKSGQVRKINSEIERLKKKRKGILTRALYSKTFGILLSTKPGQSNVKLAEEIKKKLEKKGKKAEILVSNSFDPLSLQNFQSFECYVTTACPRISEDSDIYGKPVLDIELFKDFIFLI